MAKAAILKIMEQINKLEAMIAPAATCKVTFLFDDGKGNWPAPKAGSIVLGLE